MLKGIKKTKGLGVYGDYAPPAGLAEFGIKNLIYGWNSSGKTSLSRLFGHFKRRSWHRLETAVRPAQDPNSSPISAGCLACA